MQEAPNHNGKFGIGVFTTFINEKGQVLLGHRTDHDLWNQIGGGVHTGESPEDAMIREIKEEICVDAKIIRLVGVYPKPENNELIFSFECKITNGIPCESAEVNKIEWFDPENIPKNISPNQFKRTFDALDKNKKFHFYNIPYARTLERCKDGTLEKYNEEILKKIKSPK